MGQVSSEALIKQARKFAEREHGDQKYGEHQPYITHLDTVHMFVVGLDGTPEERMAAYLHDVLEDTEATYEAVAKEFGDDVASMVKFVTDEEGQNRKERKTKTYAKLKALDESNDIHRGALLVKLCDRWANVTACMLQNNQRLLDMYRKEHPVFRDSVYRDGKYKELTEALDKALK